MPLFLATNIVFQAYNTSSWANKGVIMLLLALSVYTWATIISKSGELKIMARKNLTEGVHEDCVHCLHL